MLLGKLLISLERLGPGIYRQVVVMVSTAYQRLLQIPQHRVTVVAVRRMWTTTGIAGLLLAATATTAATAEQHQGPQCWQYTWTSETTNAKVRPRERP